LNLTAKGDFVKRKRFSLTKRGDLPIAESTAMKLRLAYLRMHRAFDRHYASFGITADQFVVLRSLSEQDDITQKELSIRISSDPNTVAAMVARLEGAGLLRRRTPPHDGRVRKLYLTAQGRRLVQDALDQSEALLDAIESIADESDTFRQLLDKIALVFESKLESNAATAP
jgi:DNA-binding MarR family transcriptional regulator